MSDFENDQANVLAQHDSAALQRENADLRARLAALEKGNVVKGGFVGEAPRYLLNDLCFLDNTLWPPGTVIECIDTPNQSMVPPNEPARRAMRAYLDGLETGARRVAALRGRDYLGLANDRNVLIDQAMADAKNHADTVQSIPMPERRGNPPPMPHVDSALAAERRGPGRPRKVLSSAMQEAPRRDMGATILAPTNPDGMQPAVVGHAVSSY